MTHSLHKIFRCLSRLGRDSNGSMVIETALVTPVLILMSLGGFEVSHMISRQHELQGGISEATAISLAANLGAETDVTELATLLRSSLDLTDGQVVVQKVFRCDASTNFVELSSECENFYGSSTDNSGGGNDADTISSYVKLQLTDTYTPVWSKFGVGGAVTYKVERMVQLS
ncbi:MAG: pilus assembly protein [Sphingomonadaceae bacterium]|nr:pilus assembly protein [Sphingomonadaceae bacterium]